MTQLITSLSVLIAIIAAFLPMLPAFIPAIGLKPIYRMRPLRAVSMAAAWLLAIAAWLNPPGSFVALPFVFLFSIPALILEPQRIFIPLVDPRHVPASQAQIRDEELVFGHKIGDNAKAWPFETLVPRHIINDQIKDEALLVAY